jgi:hypothetical protein
MFYKKKYYENAENTIDAGNPDLIGKGVTYQKFSNNYFVEENHSFTLSLCRMASLKV